MAPTFHSFGGSGDLSNPKNWTQLDPDNPVAPGPADDITISGGGTLTGVLVANSALLENDNLQGDLDTVRDTTVRGTLTISNGGILVAHAVVMEQANVAVTGPGSYVRVNNGDDGGLTIGDASDVSLTVANGGAVLLSPAQGRVEMGAYEAGNGLLNIVGTGSVFNAGGSDVVVGKEGTGTVWITSGGRLATGGQEITIGSDEGSTGNVVVDGSGSRLEAFAGAINVGGDGFGTLVVQNGAEVDSVGLNIAVGDAGATDTVDINNAILQTKLVNVGETGLAEFTIRNGARVGASELHVGTEVSGEGVVTVRGETTRLDLNNDPLGAVIDIGEQGNGRLDIEGGAGVFTSGARGKVVLGDEAGADGTLTVTDAGSVLASGASPLVVGDAGHGHMTISHGGDVAFGSQMDIGAQEGSTGDVLVTGAGSRLHEGFGGPLNVGVAGVGTLSIQDQGDVITAELHIGVNTVLGDDTVDINNATLHAGRVVIGDGGTGRMTMENGAFARTGDVDMANQEGSQGDLTLSDLGTLFDATLSQFTVGVAGTANLTITDAAVKAVNLNIAKGATGVGAVRITNAGSVDIRDNITVGDGGEGTLQTVSGASLFSGGLVVGNQVGSVGEAVVDGSIWETDRVVVGEFGAGMLSVQDGSYLVGKTFASVGDLEVGQNGEGELDVLNSTLRANFIMLGDNIGGDGNAIFDRAFITSQQIQVGNRGVGELMIRNASTVNSGELHVGTGAGGGDNLSILASTVDLTGDFVVGGPNVFGGLAAASIANGSKLTAQAVWIGEAGLGDADVIIDNATLKSVDGIVVGNGGNVNMLVEHSAIVTTQGVTTVSGVQSDLAIDHSSWTASGFIVGGGGGGDGNGTLALQDSAVLTVTGAAGYFNIGQNAGNDGAVDVTGNSKLDISQGARDQLIVGAGGNGFLKVENNSLLLTQFVTIGNGPGSDGHVILDHAGWVAFNVVDGGAGDGRLDIRNAAALDTQGLSVGVNGIGELDISGGSRVRAFDLMIGNVALSDGAVDVAGAGTNLTIWFAGNPLTANQAITVGNFGDGQMIVEDHAVVTTNTLVVAAGIGSAGNFAVSGGASLTAAQSITVGDFGFADMTVDSGATVTSQSTTIGNAPGSHGTVAIDDASWSANSFIVAGGFGGPGIGGIGDLNLLNAALVTVTGTAGTFIIGEQALSNGAVDVAGLNTTLDISGSADDALYVGWSGVGALVVEQGGTLKTQNTTIGNFGGSDGNVTIDGGSWTASNITDGSNGFGYLEIENQAIVEATSVTVAQFGHPGVIDRLDVDDARLAISQDFIVGNSGNALVTTENGGIISVGNNLNIAAQFGSNGDLIIDDANANLSVGQFFNVGIAGNGSASFKNAAIVSADFVRIGGGAQAQGLQFVGTGNGNVTVTDAGTRFSVTNTDTTKSGLAVGFNGNGTLSVANAAEVDVTGNTNVGLDVGSSGTLNVASAGIVNTANLTLGGGTSAGGSAIVTVSTGGQISVSATGTTTQPSLFMYSGVLDASGGGSVNVGAGTSAIAGAVHVAGGGVFIGAGTVRGDLVDDVAGNTAVVAKGGTLVITGKVSSSLAAGSAQLTISAGSTLELGNSDNVKVFFGHLNAGIDTLRLDQPSVFTGHIANSIRVGDTIDLVNTLVTTTSLTGQATGNPTLTVNKTGGGTLTYTFDGTLAGASRFNIASDGHGGTNLVLSDIGVTFGSVVLASDTGPSATDFITRDGHVTLAGTLNGNVTNAAVAVFDGTTFVGNATVSGSTWNISTNVTNVQGTHSFSATATSSNNGTSRAIAAQKVMVDTGTPNLTFGSVALANDTGISASDFITRDGHVTLAGTVSDALNTVSVQIFDGGSALGTATIANGAWTLSADVTANPGIHSFSATATDLAGNSTSASAIQNLTLDTAAPAVTISTAGGLTNHASQTISGTVGVADAGTSIKLYDNGSASVLGTALVQSDGSWSTSVTLSGDGAHSIVAKDTDAAGNTGASAPVTFTLDTAAPIVAIGTAGGLTNHASQTISGTVGVADAGTSIKLYDNGSASVLGTALVQSDGSWSTSVTLSGDGAHSIVARDTDAAGNTGASAAVTFTLQTSQPTNHAPVITSSAAFALAENHTAVGIVTAVDAEHDAFSFALAGGSDQAFFSIDAHSGAFNFLASPDFETPEDANHDNVYDLIVSATDVLGASSNQTIHVSVTNVAETGQTFNGGNGNDVLTGTAGNDTMSGGNGDDTLNGGDGNDNVSGGNGNDTLTGGRGDDVLDGGDGNDTVDGGSGNNQLSGGNGNDTLRAGDGNNLLDGGNGNDILIAGNGNNTFTGGNGNDTITAGNGNNTITAGNGNENVTVGNGNNTITGGNGNDTFHVGTGNNTLTGGNGNDSFVFGPGFGKDVITDFAHGDHVEFVGVFANFAAVQAAMHQVGVDTVISLDADHAITLTHITASSLHAGDFLLT